MFFFLDKKRVVRSLVVVCLAFAFCFWRLYLGFKKILKSCSLVKIILIDKTCKCHKLLLITELFL